jgi:hypothetical protein
VQGVRIGIQDRQRAVLRGVQSGDGQLIGEWSVSALFGPQLPGLQHQRGRLHKMQHSLRGVERRLLAYLLIDAEKCQNGTQLSFYDTLNSVCLPMDQTCSSSFPTYYKNTSMLKCTACVTNVFLHGNSCRNQCPTNFTANVNNYCVCNINGTLTVDDMCLQVPICPIKTGWDSLSSSCVSCEFGCLTCYDDGCTSCFPGYFLYVSPQGVFCRKKSPLYTCDQQYGWINGACLLTDYSNPLYRLTKCLASITNCQACFPNSDTMCASCKPGYLNLNNTCVSQCPNNTISYAGLTCIFSEISNCTVPYL